MDPDLCTALSKCLIWTPLLGLAVISSFLRTAKITEDVQKEGSKPVRGEAWESGLSSLKSDPVTTEATRRHGPGPSTAPTPAGTVGGRNRVPNPNPGGLPSVYSRRQRRQESGNLTVTQPRLVGQGPSYLCRPSLVTGGPTPFTFTGHFLETGIPEL